MNKIIISELHVIEFLYYCSSFNYQATVTGHKYETLNPKLQFIFTLNKMLQEDDYVNIKRRCPSFELYGGLVDKNKSERK